MSEFSVAHLIPNDRKFFDHVTSIMEAVNPSQNHYVVAPGHAVLRLDEEPRRGGAHICNTLEEFNRIGCRIVAEADGVIAHSLETYMTEPLSAAAPEAPVLWAVWGGDLAEAMPLYRYATLLPKTAAARLSVAIGQKLNRSQPGPATERLARLVARTFDPKWWPAAGRALGRTRASPAFRNVAERVDIFACLEPTPGLAEAIPEFTGIWQPEFKYYVIDVPRDVVAGPDILIGNRATASCNHLDAFEDVQRAGLTDGRIVLPLNYGHRSYADYVEGEARRMFGDRVLAIRDWMPFDDYSKIVAKCGTVLMNFRRGQALGTTALSMAQGARVFLRKENLHYRYYSRLGMKVFAIDKPEDRALLGRPLDAEIQKLNRDIIAKNWSREAAETRASELLASMQMVRAEKARSNIDASDVAGQFA